MTDCAESAIDCDVNDDVILLTFDVCLFAFFTDGSLSVLSLLELLSSSLLVDLKKQMIGKKIMESLCNNRHKTERNVVRQDLSIRY